MEKPTKAAAPFPEASFGLLEDLEDRSFWFRSRNRLLVWALRTYFPEARSLLEVGCGTGYVLAGVHAALPELELTGVELYAVGVEVARKRVPDATLLEVDARSLPFEAAFDVVGAFDVIEHVDEDELVLAQMCRAVRPGGGALVTVPQHPRLWSVVDDFGGHRRRYRRAELVGKLERAGFVVERTTSFVSLLLPALALSRLRQRNQSLEELDPCAEFRSGAFLDGLLERVMRAEAALIRRGVWLPAGGSLLAIARRPE